jgi:hypothetical protein
VIADYQPYEHVFGGKDGTCREWVPESADRWYTEHEHIRRVKYKIRFEVWSLTRENLEDSLIYTEDFESLPDAVQRVKYENAGPYAIPGSGTYCEHGGVVYHVMSYFEAILPGWNCENTTIVAGGDMTGDTSGVVVYQLGNNGRVDPDTLFYRTYTREIAPNGYCTPHVYSDVQYTVSETLQKYMRATRVVKNEDVLNFAAGLPLVVEDGSAFVGKIIERSQTIFNAFGACL